MRTLMAVLVLMLLPLATEARQRHRDRRGAPPPPPPPVTPQPYIAPPLLPAGWSRLRMPEEMADDWWRRSPRHARPYFRPSIPYGSYYAVPYGGAGFYATESESRTTAATETRTAGVVTTGWLRLEITPAVTMQYYADGYFIGGSPELGHDLELNAGARRIEIRAQGYTPLTFDTHIVAGRDVIYRGTLEPIAADQPSAPKPTGPKTMFVIPGCYMGNVAPHPGALPKGCDVRRMTTR